MATCHRLHDLDSLIQEAKELCRKSVEINERHWAAAGWKDGAKALILLTLGNNGQQRAHAKTGSNPYLPAISKP